MEAIEQVQKQIKKLEEKKLDLETKLMENFKYGFKWYAEDLYKTISMLNEYKIILDALEKGTKIEIIIDWLQGQVNNWSISISTCPLQVQESIYEFEATKEIINHLKWYF